MRYLHLTGPDLDKTVHAPEENHAFWFTSFGTFRKSDGCWIVDPRFKVTVPTAPRASYDGR